VQVQYSALILDFGHLSIFFMAETLCLEWIFWSEPGVTENKDPGPQLKLPQFRLAALVKKTFMKRSFKRG
jgi:hypothetical protein